MYSMYVRASLYEVYNDRIMKGRSFVYTRVSRRIKSASKNRMNMHKQIVSIYNDSNLFIVQLLLIFIDTLCFIFINECRSSR